MKRRSASICLLAVGLALGLAGCGKRLSPSEVVTAMYDAANAKEYAKAKGLLTTEVKEKLNSRDARVMNVWRTTCDSNTMYGTITKVEIVDEKIKGDAATVTATIHYKKHPTKENDKTYLAKEKGRWRISK